MFNIDLRMIGLCISNYILIVFTDLMKYLSAIRILQIDMELIDASMYIPCFGFNLAEHLFPLWQEVKNKQ